MKKLFLSLLVSASLASAATEKLVLDTKTHALTSETGGTIIDAKAVTLTVGGMTIYDGAGVKTIVTGTTSGAMFGASGNKIGFLGATPIVRPAATTDLKQALVNLGLYTTGGASPLNLNGGAFTSGPISSTTGSFSGNTTVGGTLGVTGTTSIAALNATTGTFSSSISATNATLSGTLGVGGTFGVTGATTLHALTATTGTFSGILDVSGDSTFGGSLDVTNDINLGGDADFAGTLNVGGTSTLATVAATSGTFSGALASGPFSATTGTFSSSISATNAALSGTLSVTSNGTVGGTLEVTGATTLHALTATTGNFTSQIDNLDFIDVSRAPYNADPTGATDATAAFNSAIAAAVTAQKGVYSPEGTYRISSRIDVTSPVVFYGPGVLKWYGASGGTMMKMSRYRNTSVRNTIQLTLDANNLAATALEIDGVSGGSYEIKAYDNLNGPLLKLWSTGSNYTCSWLTLKVDLASYNDGGCLLRLGGNYEGNACHIVFHTLKLAHGGTKDGIQIGGADNISFLMTFIYRDVGDVGTGRPAGTGVGVRFDPLEAPPYLPAGINFYHLQAGLGGLVLPPETLANPGAIFYYAQDNGEPDPVTNGKPLTIMKGNGDFSGLGFLTATGDIFTNGSITSRSPNNTNRETIGVDAGNYPTSFTTSYLTQGGPSSTGTIAGQTWANTGGLIFQNTERAVIGTNNDVPVIFMANGSEVLRIASGEIDSKKTIFANNPDASNRSFMGAAAADYATSFAGTYLTQGGSSTPGSIAGQAWAGSGVLMFQNTIGGAVTTNNNVPITVAPNNVPAARFDSSATSGDTRFLLYDVTAGTLKRVSVGAADSGGTGYKVLRVPN